jgi:hypothetical protein
MSSARAGVNLWKTEKVSYLETLSHSTEARPLHAVDCLEEDATNMVLDRLVLRG